MTNADALFARIHSDLLTSQAPRTVFRTECCIDRTERDSDGIPECRSCGCPFPRTIELDVRADAHLL